MYALLQGWYISWERLHLLSGVWAGGGGGDGVDISMNMLTCLDLPGKARKVKITECVNNVLLITMELNCKS